jgi:hypothetical protein
MCILNVLYYVIVTYISKKGIKPSPIPMGKEGITWLGKTAK